MYHLGWELSQLSFGAVDVGLLDIREFGCSHVTVGWIIDCWVLKVLCFSSCPLLLCCFTGALRYQSVCRVSRDVQTRGLSPAQSYRRFLTQTGFWLCSLGFGEFLSVYFTLAKESNSLFLKENKVFEKMAILWKASEVLRFCAHFWWPVWPRFDSGAWDSLLEDWILCNLPKRVILVLLERRVGFFPLSTCTTPSLVGSSRRDLCFLKKRKLWALMVNKWECFYSGFQNIYITLGLVCKVFCVHVFLLSLCNLFLALTFEGQ